MKLLILGGTAFLGRHITKAALNKGHQVTLFNRNKTNTSLYPDVERLQGDRDGGLEVLRNRTWDAVLDLSGFVPRLVGDTCRLLQNSVDHYLFVSTCSVYDLEITQTEINEASPLLPTAGIETEDWVSPAHGPLKRLCEQTVTDYFAERSTILRPGYIVGPHDNTDRMTYWVDRVARGGEVFVPQNPQDSFQMIDARDLAEFSIACVEKKISATLNTTGDWQTWQSWLDACQQAGGNDVTFCWANDARFIAQQVGEAYRPFGAFPLFNNGVFTTEMTNKKALAAGLRIRPTLETAKDLLNWHNERLMSDKECPTLDLLAAAAINTENTEAYWMAGINTADEKRLLSAWREWS